MTLPLLLLPGMMCDARLFAPQISALESERDVFSGDITGADTVPDIARQVLGRAPPRFALAGLSMGGIVAMEMVAQAPDRIAGLALMDTNPKAEVDQIKAQRGPQIAKAGAGQLASVMRDEMKPHYIAEGDNKPAILDLCMAMALDLGSAVFARQSRALRDRPDQCAALIHYKGPTLILCGEEDKLCPVHRHTLLHDLMPHATLIIMPHVGHLPTLENPDKTTAALQGWLKEIDHG